MVERIGGDFPLFVKRQRSSHQIIIPRASSVVRNNVVISLNPIQSPSQLIVGAPFVAKNSHIVGPNRWRRLSSLRQGNAHLVVSCSYMYKSLSYHLYLPLLGPADGER